MTIDELRDLMLENFVDEDGDLDITQLDFTDFEGDVYIGRMRVKKDLVQDYQEVEGSLFQHTQEVGGNLYQYSQNVGGHLWQNYQKVEGELIQDKKIKGE